MFCLILENFLTKVMIPLKGAQRHAALTVDGEVGPDTWTALGGSFEVDRPGQGRLAAPADFALVEAAKDLRRQSGSSEAEKYLQPFRAPMRRLGHLGDQIVFYNWRAAFITYCCREVGINIPDQPQGFWATMALVESWKFRAQSDGFRHPRGKHRSAARRHRRLQVV